MFVNSATKVAWPSTSEISLTLSWIDKVTLVGELSLIVTLTEFVSSELIVALSPTAPSRFTVNLSIGSSPSLSTAVKITVEFAFPAGMVICPELRFEEKSAVPSAPSTVVPLPSKSANDIFNKVSESEIADENSTINLLWSCFLALYHFPSSWSHAASLPWCSSLCQVSLQFS